MLLSKGLRFNTYQQMQLIQASANQSSVSLQHALAGADDCRKVSLLIERDQIQTHMKSSLGYASQLTRSWLNIPILCTLLPADMSGMEGQMCCSQPEHPQWSSQKAPTLGPPQNATNVGWECHSAFGEGNRSRKGFWMLRLCILSAGRNLLKLPQMGCFLSYFE